jgi:hypothetical protein
MALADLPSRTKKDLAFSAAFREAERARKGAGNKRSALQWLFKKIKARTNREPYAGRPNIGSMCAFAYTNPKYREKLKYYDALPLVIVVSYGKGTMLGLNLHYIPPNFRLLLMRKLFEAPKRPGPKRGDRLVDAIQPFLKIGRIWKFAFKRYITARISTSIVSIPKEEWIMAYRLPMADFKKMPMTQVWQLGLQKA